MKQKDSQSSSSAAIRHAERGRSATCAFADAVAKAVLEKYESCGLGLSFDGDAAEQTVLSGLVVGRLGEPPEVVSFGIGTKFLKDAQIEADVCKEHVHDMHAEVLCRRAFIRFLYFEISDVVDGKESKFLERTGGKVPFRLKPGLHLHFYSSSSPCGNSVVRQWAKGKEEPKFSEDEVPSFVWPKLEHPWIDISNRKYGQIASCVKRDAKGDGAIGPLTPCYPPGTAPPNSGQGTLLSCSDKIAIWNCVGWQGKRLAGIIEPLYVTTITIGRKFSRPHLARAVCCRLQELTPLLSNTPFRLSHPTLLRTSLKLNHGAISQNATASFSSSLCAAWTSTDSSNPVLLRGASGEKVTQRTPEGPKGTAADCSGVAIPERVAEISGAAQREALLRLQERLRAAGVAWQPEGAFGEVKALAREVLDGRARPQRVPPASRRRKETCRDGFGGGQGGDGGNGQEGG